MNVDGFCLFYRFACDDRPINVQCDLNVHGYLRSTMIFLNISMEAIGRLCHLATLHLDIRYLSFDSEVKFTPLAAIPSLRRLTIILPSSVELTDGQVDDLRALPHLDYLRANDLTRTTTLSRLLREPHSLQWKHITPYAHGWGNISAATLQLLPQLPSLTELSGLLGFEILGFDSSVVECLSKLPRLSTLIVDAFFNKPEFLVACLQECRQITHLSLEAVVVNDADMAKIMSCMPLLRTLELRRMTLASLSFLQIPTLSRTLTELRLQDISVPSSAHVFLGALRALRSLYLGPLSQPLDAETLARYTPPSALLPELTEFVGSIRVYWPKNVIQGL